MLRTFSFAVSAAVMMVFAIAPLDWHSSQAEAAADQLGDSGQLIAPAQVLAVSGQHTYTVERESYKVTPKPVVVPAPSNRSAPAAGRPDPGSAKAIAHRQVTARGWGEAEYSCLVALWNKESGWNVYAHNASSGAYGIPQSLPGSKMASAGADWASNPATQIKWGLGYIQGRYGSPCSAWGASQIKGWY